MGSFGAIRAVLCKTNAPNACFCTKFREFFPTGWGLMNFATDSKWSFWLFEFKFYWIFHIEMSFNANLLLAELRLTHQYFISRLDLFAVRPSPVDSFSHEFWVFISKYAYTSTPQCMSIHVIHYRSAASACFFPQMLFSTNRNVATSLMNGSLQNPWMN